MGRRDEPMHTEQRAGYTINIHHEPEGFGLNPRDYDGNACAVTWDRSYNSPDSNDYGWGTYDDAGAFDFLAFLKERKTERHSKDPGVIYAWLDRNGYDGTLTTRDLDQSNNRDMHRADGVIYATYEQIRAWGFPRLTAALKAKTLKDFDAELQTYNDWATGNIYYYQVTDDSGEVYDDCGGYIGDYDAEYSALTEARAVVDHMVAAGKLPAPSDDDCEEDAEQEIAEYMAHLAAD